MTTDDPGMDELWGAGTPDGFRRLWAPHRMAYIVGESGTGEVDGRCPLCRIPMMDADGLVLARGETVYAVLNLHPYTPGTSWSCPTVTSPGSTS